MTYHAVYPCLWKQSQGAATRETEEPVAMFIHRQQADIFCSCWPSAEVRELDLPATVLQVQLELALTPSRP